MQSAVCIRCIGTKKCSVCGGTGKILAASDPRSDGQGLLIRPCESCDGSGACECAQPPPLPQPAIRIDETLVAGLARGVVESMGPQPGGPEPGMSLHVLVVEDDEDSAETTAMLLELLGHTTEVVGDGPAALAAVQAQRPDVILLDIGLPGMDGWALAKQLAVPAAGLRPVLIAVTGRNRPADRQRSADAGIALHLAKPVDPRELADLLLSIQRAIARELEQGGCSGPTT